MKIRWSVALPIIAYITLVFVLVIRHSVWQDEGQAWLIARDMPFWSMFTLAGYEGNGMLWHALIYPFAHFGASILSMQILNAAFAAAAVYVILRYAPFPAALRIAIISGYFFMFEYAVIARNYSISVFLIFLIAALYKTRFERPGRFFILLVILSLTNLHSCIISIVIAAMFAYETWYAAAPITKKTAIKVLVFFAYAVLMQAIMLRPPSDLWSYTSATHYEMTARHFSDTILTEIDAFTPVPQVRSAFWETSQIKPSSWAPFIALVILVCSFIPLMRHKKAMALYGGMSGLLLLLFFLKYNFHMRHEGFLYMSWLFAYWISYEHRGHASKMAQLLPISNLFIGIVAGAQIYAALIAYDMSFKVPFTNYEQMASFIGHAQEGVPVMVYPGWLVGGLAPYLPSNYRFVCIETMAPCTYMVWTQSFERNTQTNAQIRANIVQFQTTHPDQPFYVLFNRSTAMSTLNLGANYRPYVNFMQKCTSGYCNYYMYEYVPPRYHGLHE